MNQTKRLLCAAILAGGALAAGAGVCSSAQLPGWTSGSEPIQIDSQSLEARAEEGVVVFEGEVVARQGDLTLQADRVAVYMDQATSEIRTAEAIGSVRIQRQDMVATGGEATYDVSLGVVELSGDAKAWRGKNVVEGDRIILYLAEDRIVVEGGTKMLIFPGERTAPQ